MILDVYSDLWVGLSVMVCDDSDRVCSWVMIKLLTEYMFYRVAHRTREYLQRQAITNSVAAHSHTQTHTHVTGCNIISSPSYIL